MNHAARARRTTRRVFAILATLGLVTAASAVLAPGVTAVANTCRARNLTRGPAYGDSDLQRVINKAHRGDTISVKYRCVGSFTIDKRLTLVGHPTPGVPIPVLHGNRAGRVLLISAKVTLSNLKITRGVVPGKGGGILNTGNLTLNDTVVTGNTANYGGGISNREGLLTLNGSSSVSGNTAEYSGGGIYNWQGAVTMNDSSSVSGNTNALDSGGGILNAGTLTLKDSSAINGNTLTGKFGQGGGIFNGDSGIVNACDGTGVDEWIGTVEPNTPNDYLDSNVALISCT